jgi:hypothetical protein
MKRAYVIEWQTPSMSAPAFWYYAAKRDAEDVADRLHKTHTRADVRAADVADDTPLMGIDVNGYSYMIDTDGSER